MAPLSLFQRLDRNGSSRITYKDIYTYLKEIDEYDITESDCFNLVKYFS